MWFFNVFLYLLFLFAPQYYQAFKDNGAPCYSWHAMTGAETPSAQPACFYDPSNTNPGY